MELKQKYVKSRYDSLMVEIDQARSCLFKINKLGYVIQISGIVLSLLVTSLAGVEESISNHKHVMAGLGALCTLTNGINSVLLQIERRKRVKIDSCMKIMSKIVESLEDNEITNEEFSTILNLENVDEKN